jgi:hypothetical protein
MNEQESGSKPIGGAHPILAFHHRRNGSIGQSVLRAIVGEPISIEPAAVCGRHPGLLVRICGFDVRAQSKIPAVVHPTFGLRSRTSRRMFTFRSPVELRIWPKNALVITIEEGEEKIGVFVTLKAESRS